MNVSKQSSRPKRVPERTCVGCRRARPKGELIRIVGTDSDGVVIDATGRRAGRGVYLCKSRSCWESGLKKDRLDRSLRTKISAEGRQELARYGETLPG
ncbi:MAG: YlxR family protein [Chloroflexota bacterium]|nr:YlxR family protein [Chloroflexota bacterium]